MENNHIDIIAEYRFLVVSIKNGVKDDIIMEWECLETSSIGFKFQNKVDNRNGWSFGHDKTDVPFWVLRSDIDSLGMTKYQILERLVKKEEQNIN